MAKRIRVILIDDVDGGPAVETVRFGHGSLRYEIDVNDANRAKLREDLAALLRAREDMRGRARRARLVGPGRPTQKRGRTNPRLGEIRRWALDAGYEVSGRGRIPNEVMSAYEEAVGGAK